MSKQQGTAKTFTDLIVWKKAHQFVLDIYSITKEFPQSEIYGLAQQLRRSAVSIAANIAEGFKKRSIPDKARFMNIAQGSLEESRYYLILTNDLGYTETGHMINQIEEVSKLLEAYYRTIKKSEN